VDLTKLPVVVLVSALIVTTAVLGVFSYEDIPTGGALGGVFIFGLSVLLVLLVRFLWRFATRPKPQANAAKPK